MKIRFWLLLACCLGGLLINGLLAWWKLTESSGNIIGCGGANGCGDVFASRWSQVLGLPIALMGAFLYLVLYASLVWEKERLTTLCYGAIIGSAIWLIFVQVIILRYVCPWCMAAHGIGLVAVGIGCFSVRWDDSKQLGLFGGIAAAFAMALGQLYGPLPMGHQMANIQQPWVMKTGPMDIHAVGTGRKISFNNGRKIYDTTSSPCLGSPDAEHVLVEYFDFQCSACQRMRFYLNALIEKYPQQVGVLALPVPLDHACNHGLPAATPGHPASCHLTKIALAVWKIKPSAYPIIHEQFMSDPPMNQATAMAFAHVQVEPAKLALALKDPWLDHFTRANIEDWLTFSGNSKHLPKLLINDKRILHGLPTGAEEFIQVMEKELGL